MPALTNSVILRNRDFFSQGKWLLANPQSAEIYSELQESDVFGFHQYFDVYQQACNNHDPKCHQFAAQYKATESFDGAVVYMPKAKAHGKMLIANMAAAVKPGGQLLLVGENKAGIKSAAKLLEPFSTQVNKIDSARHCTLFCAQLNQQPKSFDIQQWTTHFTININDTALSLVSVPGVFGHGELDAGTQLLLENIVLPIKGRVLDFACGDGVIGCYIAKTQPKTEVVMSDVSALATYCAEQSARQNNLQCSVIASDGLDGITGKFNAVYTNPPFHTGIQTNYSVTERFISQLKSKLTPYAHMVLVANRFLKYPDAIEQSFGKVNVLAKTSKFSLYRATTGK